MTLLSSVVEAIVRAAEMTWETWWALVLGFTLSGLVEVFASEERMSRLLGGDGWREVGAGMFFGAASSSCSYSAVGTSKSLFKKGASGVASLGAFLFAATDLVVELGLVAWVLLGWQFVVGEYLGGVVATVVIVLVLKHVVPGRWFDAARERVHRREETTCAACDMELDPLDEETASRETIGGTKYFCCGGCLRAYEGRPDVEADGEGVGLADKLFTAKGWDTAAKKTMREWEMLWKDIAIGFVLASVIAAFVPQSWWVALFGTESTVQLVLMNVVIGAVIGIVTFMCSVGNIPFALVLWRNGLPFGGILSFIYADLIIPPLVNMYRRYYGWRVALALFGSIFLAAVVSGVVVHFLFSGIGLIPPRQQLGGTLSGEYTAVLNFLFTPVFLAQVYVTYGPERIVAFCTSLPKRTRARLRGWIGACCDVGGILWLFCLDLADAVLLVAETLWLLVEAIRTLGTALWSAVEAVTRVVRRLYEYLSRHA